MIHICGRSAVGKSTLVNHILSVRERMGRGEESRNDMLLLDHLEVEGECRVYDSEKGELEKVATDKAMGLINSDILYNRVDTLIHDWQYRS